MNLPIEWGVISQANEIFTLTQKGYPDCSWSEDIFKLDLCKTTSYYFGGRIKGKLISYVGASLVLDELSITNVVVDPFWQNQGLGRKMLMKYFSQLEQPMRILLEVRVSNLPALKLYSRLGFEIYYIRENYYRNPVEAAYLMDLKINGWRQ